MTDYRGTGRKHNVNVSGQEASFILARVTGDEEIVKRLAMFRESGIRRVMVAAVRTQTREAAKYLKQTAPRSDIKKAIGYRATRLSSPTQAVAKAGVNVGKRPQRFQNVDQKRLASGSLQRSTSRRAQKLLKTIQKAQKKGYATSSIVWIVLGTIRRFTRTGAHRGRMQSTFSVHRSLQPGLGRVRLAAKNAAIQQIEKEMSKL